MSIYAFQATLENSETYSLERYRGQAIIVVNTATKCGLSPQFNELEELFQRYRDQGLMVLGFLPTNSNKKFILLVKLPKLVAQPMVLTFRCIN